MRAVFLDQAEIEEHRCPSGILTVWHADRDDSFWKYRVVLTGTETGFDVIGAQAYDTPF